MQEVGTMESSWAHVVRGFTGKRVLVVGDVMVDEYLFGEVRRICPEAPVPVIESRRRQFLPGGAANAAANLAALGARVSLGGLVGVDAAGKALRSLLADWGIDGGGLLAEPGRSTTVKMRMVAQNQQVLRIDTEQTADLRPQQVEALARWVDESLAGCDACLLSDYGKGVVTPELARRVLVAARRTGRPVVADPKGIAYGKYQGATLVKPNLQELGAFVHRPVDTEAALVEAGTRLADELPGTVFLVTRGAAGMSLFQAGRRPVHLPAIQVRQVFDVTGAGDTVAAVLALALGCGAPVEHAARLASVAAGLVVSKVGTAVVTAQELEEALAARFAGSHCPEIGWPEPVGCEKPNVVWQGAW